jgi:periplasmic protein TonB
MLTVALLALFTLLCLLLSADRAWDNVTKPERNSLVFDGRNRAYGAFVLRREYDRRFVWAFLGAVGLLGGAVGVPHAMAALGLYAPVVRSTPHVPWIDVVMNEEPRELPRPKPLPEPEKPQPKPASGGPMVPSNPDAPVVVVDSLVPTTPEPAPKPQPEPLPGGGGGGGPEPGKGKPGDDGGTVEFTLDAPGNPGIVDDAPEYPGGQAALARFIQDNLRVTNEDITQAREQVIFVVDVDGSVTRVKARGRSAKDFCDAAERVVRMMPKWKPAKYKGRDVPCVMVLPIEFRTR